MSSSRAGESSGLYVSTNAGDTWKPMKVRGMEPGGRITAMAFWNWLVVGTFAEIQGHPRPVAYRTTRCFVSGCDRASVLPG